MSGETQRIILAILATISAVVSVCEFFKLIFKSRINSSKGNNPNDNIDDANDSLYIIYRIVIFAAVSAFLFCYVFLPYYNPPSKDDTVTADSPTSSQSELSSPTVSVQSPVEQTQPATEATAVVTVPETAPTEPATEPFTEPPTEAPRPQFSGPSYFMREDDSLKDVDPTKWNETYFWNQKRFTREEIEEILFVSERPVLSSSAFGWDVSASRDNTVRAYVDTGILYVVSDGRIAFPKNAAFLLAGFCNAKEISFENPVDTSNAVTMERLFSDCNAVRELDLYSFDTSQVRNMGHMFAKCRSLTQLNLQTFDTHRVTDMECMFYGCKKLDELNLSGFDTSSVETMVSMFAYCEQLPVLDISCFDVSSVKYMTYMFNECVQLQRVELGKFKTSSLRDINAMFYNCHSLQEIDTSGWNLSGLTNCTKTFEKCTSLTNINADHWNFPKNVRPVDFMEDGCTINGIPWKDYFKQLS